MWENCVTEVKQRTMGAEKRQATTITKGYKKKKKHRGETAKAHRIRKSRNGMRDDHRTTAEMRAVMINY